MSKMRHVVMWRVLGDSTDERLHNAHRVQASFESMRGRVPGLRQLEVGLDTSRVGYACDVVLVCEFDDAAALAAYASHPEHLRAKAETANLRIERYQVDYPSP
jgi:Stress responsive A/B Barrel Domain